MREKEREKPIEIEFYEREKRTSPILLVLFNYRRNPPQFVVELARCPKITERKKGGKDLGRAYTGRKDYVCINSQIAYSEAIKRGNES